MSFLLERLKMLTRNELKKAFGYTMIVFPDDCFNLAVAQKDKKMFHIRPDGTPAYKQRFDWVGPFCERLAVVQENGKRFHIQPDGTPAYKQRFDVAGPFSGGRADVGENGKMFRIRTDGTRAD
jgi:hypothetical protein